MSITRAEWMAERDERNRRTGAWGFDPGMPWRIANWKERAGIVCFQFVMWGVIFPTLLIVAAIIFGAIMDGVTRYNTEHDRCLKRATNGYEIRACR